MKLSLFSYTPYYQLSAHGQTFLKNFAMKRNMRGQLIHIHLKMQPPNLFYISGPFLSLTQHTVQK